MAPAPIVRAGAVLADGPDGLPVILADAGWGTGYENSTGEIAAVIIDPAELEEA